MIHRPADVVLLTLVVLRRLVVVSWLLLLWSLPLSTVVELAWSILGIPLGTTTGIVSSLTTSKARITTDGIRGVVPHRCSSRAVLAILQKVGMLHCLTSTLSLLLLLVLLVGALVLILPVVDTLSSSAKRCSLEGAKRGRELLLNCPDDPNFLFCSPISLRACSTMMALSTIFWKFSKVCTIS
jgi:hypothetical protein